MRNMTEPFKLDKGTFLSMAKAFGLDADESHMEDLYAYVQSVLPALGSIRDLDLTGIEPVGPPIVLSSFHSDGKKTRRKE